MLEPLDLPRYDSDKKDRNEERSAAKFAKRGEHPGYPCIVCGTFTGPNPTTMIHVCRGGGMVADPKEPHIMGITDGEEAGCLLFYPIGSSCLRKFPALRPYVVTMDTVRSNPDPLPIAQEE